MNAAIDCISVRSDASKGDVIASGRSLFTGRYWTGYISIGVHKNALNHDLATADLRAGVAAVSWLEQGCEAESPILVSGSDDGSIDVWQCSPDAQHLEHLEGKSAHDHIVSSISTPLQGNVAATGSWDLRVRVWDTVAFLESAATFVGHTDLVHSVCWADFGNSAQTLFSASQDGTVRQWDVRDSLCASVIRLQQPATVATWCPGSGILAVGDELGSLTFFDVRKGSVQLACLHKLHHDAVRAIAAPSSESSTFVASSGDDGRICTIPKGSQISAMKQQVRTPHKDGSYIRGLHYGSKGLYSAGWDGRLECAANL